MQLFSFLMLLFVCCVIAHNLSAGGVDWFLVRSVFQSQALQKLIATLEKGPNRSVITWQKNIEGRLKLLMTSTPAVNYQMYKWNLRAKSSCF